MHRRPDLKACFDWPGKLPDRYEKPVKKKAVIRYADQTVERKIETSAAFASDRNGNRASMLVSLTGEETGWSIWFWSNVLERCSYKRIPVATKSRSALFSYL
jgi:hypothetical protein